MPVVIEERPKRIVPPPLRPGSGGGDDGSGDWNTSSPISKRELGLWILLTGVFMLFAGLTSAYMVLRGVPGWQSIAIPPLLWGNTVVLLASSVSIEFARRALKKSHLRLINEWLVVTGILGFIFLAGQFLVWRQLVNAGVYIHSTLHGGFLYVLTATHGIHLLGGIVALIYVLGKARVGKLTVFNHAPLNLFSTYWHFMDALWLYLFALLVLA
ncbi:MAG: cytochrome c oxidase subunit 3 [Acidobacteria bacterium]|nr:cytochrome c oxidase subunit 3 [Acidobacteriota bacterium]